MKNPKTFTKTQTQILTTLQELSSQGLIYNLNLPLHLPHLSIQNIESTLHPLAQKNLLTFTNPSSVNLTPQGLSYLSSLKPKTSPFKKIKDFLILFKKPQVIIITTLSLFALFSLPLSLQNTHQLSSQLIPTSSPEQIILRTLPSFNFNPQKTSLELLKSSPKEQLILATETNHSLLFTLTLSPNTQTWNITQVEPLHP